MHAPIVNIAIAAIRAAETIIVQALKRPLQIKVTEKNPNDFVTDVDKRVEQEIISVIHKAYPSHSILGEETGKTNGDEYQWIIDPIDGTRNFIHGFPHFAISIAVMHKNKIEHGLIYDPIRQDLFIASRGKGATLNDHRIRIGTCKTLASALLATGFAYRHSNPENPLPPKILQTVLPLAGDIRRTGSAALDLAYVAANRLDVFWEFGIKLWDMAAGILLVREAGGFICDTAGGEEYLQTGNVVAANPVLMRQFLKTIKPITV